MIKEIMKAMQGLEQAEAFLDQLRALPGGDRLIRYLDDTEAPPSAGDGAP